MSTATSQSKSTARRPSLARELTAEKRAQKLIAAVEAVATLLSAPRDRLGRLEPAQAPHSHEARETVRMMSIEYGVGPSKDYIEQAAQVLKAAVAEHQQPCKKCGGAR